MDQNLNYNPFILMIYGEIGLIIALVVITYGLYLFYQRRRQQQQGNMKKIQHYLQTPGALQAIPSSWQHLPSAVAALHQVAEHPSSMNPERVVQFNEKVIRPLAKRWAKRRFWYFRYLAAKGYSYAAQSADEPEVLALLQDSHPSVSIEASHVIKRIPSKKLVNALIDKVAYYQRKNYEFYLNVFRELPLNTQEYLVERLGYERRLTEKALCYKMLTLYSQVPRLETAYQEVQSPNIELAIAAIHYVLAAEPNPPAAWLQQLLADPRRDIKIFSLAAVAKHRWPSVLEPVVGMLEDPEPLVRLSAAKALKWLGAPGIQRLQQRHQQQDSLAQVEIAAVLAALATQRE